MLFFPLLNAKLYKIFYWDKYFLIKVQKLTVISFTLRGVKTGYNKWLCSAKRLEYCLAGLGKLNFQNSCVELIYILYIGVYGVSLFPQISLINEEYNLAELSAESASSA